ncbi:MAG: universal stress protein [Marinoscillum sp.]|uniref:universal stress protein n=1 Tax=Marinoscillum sp. TaxID=2024838 RepID=UPI0032FE3684
MKNTKIEPYKVALVALDLSEMDDHLIKYMAMISESLSLERIFFVHIAKTLELPEELLQKYPSLLDPLDESIENGLKKKVYEHFGASQISVECMVQEGNSIEKILKLCKIKNIDLLVMGRKKNLQGSGLVSSKIARKCPCSLLLVTEEHTLGVKNILVPLDFSKHSALAMGRALKLSESTKAKLLTMHVYAVPIGYYKTGKSYTEFAEIMKSLAEKEYQRFLSQHEFPTDIPCEYILSKDGNHSALTYALAERTHSNMIILGSRGRTNLSSVLMGSVAEKLVYLDSSTPILIVKDKGENMGFMEALSKI